MPMPAVFAFSMAMRIAFAAVRCPIAKWPSISAETGVSRRTSARARTSTLPLLMFWW